MSLTPHLRLSIPQRLMLLTIIPMLGLLGLGGMYLHTLCSEYRSYLADAGSFEAIQREVADFVQIVEQLSNERGTARRRSAGRSNDGLLSQCRSEFAATERVVEKLLEKIDQLASSP